MREVGGGGGESLECNSRLKKDELNFPCIDEDLRNYPPPPPPPHMLVSDVRFPASSGCSLLSGNLTVFFPF